MATPHQQTSSATLPAAQPQAGYLRLEGIVKRFGALTVVDGVLLDIPQGAFVTLLGPSGCGKTTLLRIIAGFYEPDGGTIQLDGKRIDHLPSHQRGTAMVFQDYALFPHMTVGDNVGYGLRLAGAAQADIKRRVAGTLEFVGLAGLADRWPNQLSGGQQQRVALARALIVEPKVLLLDEPLSNLDANLRERMRWELRALQQRLNITFLYVTHDQAEALAMSDWIAVMSGGRIEQWGTPQEVYNRPRTPFVANFIGAANLRPARVLEKNGATVRIELYDHALSMPAPATPVGDEVLLCIRPEAIKIGIAAPDRAQVSLAGTVTRSAFLGSLIRYWVQIGNEEWVVDQSDPGAETIPYEGDVTLAFDPARVHLIS